MCSDASVEPVIEIDAGNDVEADRVAKIAAIEAQQPTDLPPQTESTTNPVPVNADWWSKFCSSRSQAMEPVLKGGENVHLVSAESYQLLEQWYGEEPLVVIPLSVVASDEVYEDRTVRASMPIGEAVGDIEGDLWIGSAWRSTVSAVDFGRLTLRPVNPSTKAGALSLSSGDRLIIEPSGVFKSGTMGLTNLGNSCYMNSSLQCLVHVQELAAYFVSAEYRKHLNRTNPIGYSGHVAEAFAELCRHLYCDHLGAFSPNAFKATVGRYNRAFAGYIQQDSQEFTAFLLDGLHEDLNKVVDKPATEKPELPDDKVADPEAIKELAKQCWEQHRKRNDSVILDLFTGMYKSTLVCPDCGKISITFDPFSDLTLPLPSSNVWVHKVTVVPSSGPAKQLEVALNPFANIFELKTQVGSLLDINPQTLVVGDVYDSQFYNIHDDNGIVSDSINASDDVVLYETAEDLTPLAVYSRSIRCFGIPLIVMVKGDETVEQLRSLIDSKYAQLTGNAAPSYKLSKKPGNGRVLEATFSTSFFNLQPLDEVSKPDKPEELGTPESMNYEEADQNGADDASSISSLSGPISSPDESFVSVKDTEESTSLGAQAVELPALLVQPGDILVAELEDEDGLKFSDPETVENPVAVAANSRKVKQTALDDCLDAFEKPEVLGENDFWYCNRCKELRQATKQIELWSAPDILTVHLKRFSSFQSFRDKINDVVTFPITGLDLTSRVQGTKEQIIYDLVAVDNHYGGLGGGHYTAYAKNSSDNQWYYFDDSSVTPADPEQAISGAAYLLFYRKRSSTPLGQLDQSVLDEADRTAKQTREEIKEALRQPPQVPPRPTSPRESPHPKVQALTPTQDGNQDLDSDELPGWTDIDHDDGIDVQKHIGFDSDADEDAMVDDPKLSIQDESSEEL